MKKNIIIMAFLSSLLSLYNCNSKTNNKNSKNGQGEIKMMDPNDILMTLSTIENTIPSTNQNKKGTLNLEILEDDWRQLEFISNQYIEQIKKEIDSINTTIKAESVDLGDNMTAFKNLHSRTSIPNPLESGFEWANFKNEFNSIKTGSLSFSRYGVVNNGIYIQTSNFNLYGLIQDSKITALGFHGLLSWDELDIFKTDIKKIMLKYNLVLVDWLSQTVVNTNEIDEYLKPNK